VLIVDDDAGDRKQIRRALQQSGLVCECTEADSVIAAMEACELKNFDCAFVDYRLPGQDGLAAITSLREMMPYIAIIMATGKGDEVVATEAMQRGASDYLPKAFITAQSIGRAAQNALEKAALRKRVAQQKEELENFARVLVHDLREPLNSVLGFASLIEQNFDVGKPEQIALACRLVIRAVERMRALIDTVHQYTEADSGTEFEPLDMDMVMSETLLNLEDLIKKRGARVTYDELPAVCGSAPQISQLLQNLIGNSIKYCEAPTPLVHVAATAKEDNTWLFTVSDNGIGIPDKYRQQVFQPFKRLHGIGQYEGAGLGLATCKKIVERHDGGIWCESNNGYGATFYFTLPAAQ
jgi:signal transduction histidine kinase